jgi:hypothetical protein
MDMVAEYDMDQNNSVTQIRAGWPANLWRFDG